MECPDQLEGLLDALYHAFWVEKKGVQLPEVFGPIIKQALKTSQAEGVIEFVCALAYDSC